MLYIKLFIEREKNTGQSAPECPFKGKFLAKIRIFAIFTYFCTHNVEILLQRTDFDAARIHQILNQLNKIKLTCKNICDKEIGKMLCKNILALYRYRDFRVEIFYFASPCI